MGVWGVGDGEVGGGVGGVVGGCPRCKRNSLRSSFWFFARIPL